VGLFYLF
jgi:hypothetical protein